jgi:hypothetical protein
LRILFILKKNECYSFVSYCRKSSGLYNSTRFIVQSLIESDIDAKIVEVIDNNDIDREVSLFKPDVVIIEALWVVPSKFLILKELHPKVKWFCHLHSNIPFLALEGIATEWILNYAELNIGIITNSIESYKALATILWESDLKYLPNIYLGDMEKPRILKKDAIIDIGCFGAIRPMKNHLLQALAAIEFSINKGKILNFHINSSRLETGGEPILKNLRNLLNGWNGKLIEHPWMEEDEFLNLLNTTIDIGMQVSLTETFNVVCADYVMSGIPVVTSKEVPWVSCFNKALDNSVPSMIKVMNSVYESKFLIKRNQKLLKKYSKKAQEMWLNFCYDFLF